VWLNDCQRRFARRQLIADNEDERRIVMMDRTILGPITDVAVAAVPALDAGPSATLSRCREADVCFKGL
jgi:hypothetical protein